MPSTPMPRAAIKEQTLRLRAPQAQLDLINQAARIIGTTRSAFVRDVACREAMTIVLDQTHVQLGEAALERLQALLDAPPLPSDRLRALLHSKAPWD